MHQNLQHNAAGNVLLQERVGNVVSLHQHTTRNYSDLGSDSMDGLLVCKQDEGRLKNGCVQDCMHWTPYQVALSFSSPSNSCNHKHLVYVDIKTRSLLGHCENVVEAFVSLVVIPKTIDTPAEARLQHV